MKKKILMSSLLLGTMITSSIGTTIISPKHLQTNKTTTETNEIITSKEFVQQINNYDWEKNDNLYTLESDVDFSGSEEAISLEGTIDSHKIIDFNGHTIRNDVVTKGSKYYADYSAYGYNDALQKKDSVFSLLNYVEIENVNLENIPFFVYSSSNSTYKNISINNYKLNHLFFDLDSSSKEEDLGILLATSENDILENIVVKDLNINNLIFKNAKNKSSYVVNLGLIGKAKGEIVINGFWLEDVNFTYFLLSNNNNPYGAKWFFSPLIADARGTTSLDISNGYYRGITFNALSPFLFSEKHYALVANNIGATKINIADIMMEKTLISDFSDGKDTNFGFATSSTALVNSNNISAENIYFEEEPNSNLNFIDPNGTNINLPIEKILTKKFQDITLQKKLFDDVQFMYLQNENFPIVINKSVKFILSESSVKENHLYTNSYQLTYNSKYLFDNSLKGKSVVIQTKSGKTILKETLEDNKTLSFKISKEKTYSIAIIDEEANGEIQKIIFWHSNPLAIVITIIIIILIIGLILFLWLMFIYKKRSDDTNYLETFNEMLSTEIQLLEENGTNHKDNFNDSYVDEYDNYDEYDDVDTNYEEDLFQETFIEED